MRTMKIDWNEESDCYNNYFLDIEGEADFHFFKEYYRIEYNELNEENKKYVLMHSPNRNSGKWEIIGELRYRGSAQSVAQGHHIDRICKVYFFYKRELAEILNELRTPYPRREK